MSKPYNPQAAMDRPFNMAVLFLTRLDARLNEANLNANQGYLLAWYRNLRTIYRMIHFKVKEKGHEDQEAELNQKFQRAKNLFSSANIKTSNTSLNLQINQISVGEAEILLDDIELILNDLMYEYKLIFPKFKNVPYDQEIAEDF
jgi:hypothetical protein